MSWLQKKLSLWSVVLFYATMNHFSIRLWCAMKSGFIWQPETTSSVAGPRSSKALPKAKLAPKKGHGHCLVVCCSSDPLQLSESWWNQYIWEDAQQINEMHWKLHPAAGTGQQKGPNFSPGQCPTTCHPPMLQKLNRLEYKILPHPPYSPDLLPTNYHFFKHLNNFLQGKCFHKQQEAENAFQEFTESQNTDFYTTGIKLISHWQRYVDWNDSYFD